MKKVVTMVGTSLFENYFDYTDRYSLSRDREKVQSYLEEIENRPYSERNSYSSQIGKIKEKVGHWLDSVATKGEDEKENVSAEVKSLIKISKKLKEDLDIYLLSSDTITSYVAADLIKYYLKEKLEFDKIHVKVIEDLQVWDLDRFRRGLSELVNYVLNVGAGSLDKKDVIINITGGFKATIPYLTILSQLEGWPIYYIFEKTDALMSIPNIPLAKELFDCKDFYSQENLEFILKLKEGILGDKNDYWRLRNSEFFQKYSFMMDWDDEEAMAMFNTLGDVLLARCEKSAFLFYGTKEVEEIIEKHRDWKRVLLKFAIKDIREAKTELKGRKNEYRVYDDGDNIYRVFYEEFNGDIFVYKLLPEPEEVKFLDENPKDRAKVKEEVKNYDYKPIIIYKED